MRGVRPLLLFLQLAFLAACTTTPMPPPSHTPSGTYIGLPEAAAAHQADQAGLPHRVVRRDGTSLPCTMDYSPQRLNFTLERGVVTAVSRG